MPIFNNMRKSLIPAEGAKKYLLYAIGEILLVVIGIVIALQINNWNEERKDQKFENEILTLLDRNLLDDSIMLSIELNRTILAIDLTDRLLDKVSKKQYSDSLNFWMGRIISFERFKSQASAFEVLKANGIQNLSDKKLQLLLISYYEESLFKLYESLNDVLQSFNRDWIPIIKSEFSDFEWLDHSQLNNPKAFFEKPTTVVMFKLYKDNRAGQLEKMQSSLRAISEIRKQIRLTLK